MTIPHGVAARLARGLIDTYGNRAGEVAAERAEAMAVYGSDEAAQIWADVCDILFRYTWQRAVRLPKPAPRRPPSALE
jgi:hypothetical protein